MKCAQCRKPMSPREQKQAVIERNEKGQVIAAYHKHHARRARALAREGGAVPGLVYNPDRPTAYDVVRKTSDDPGDDQIEALRERQDQIAKDRQEEERPEQWSDWRDPTTVTLDELLEAQE